METFNLELDNIQAEILSNYIQNKIIEYDKLGIECYENKILIEILKETNKIKMMHEHIKDIKQELYDLKEQEKERKNIHKILEKNLL